jgi:hypothetical protein
VSVKRSSVSPVMQVRSPVLPLVLQLRGARLRLDSIGQHGRRCMSFFPPLLG